MAMPLAPALRSWGSAFWKKDLFLEMYFFSYHYNIDNFGVLHSRLSLLLQNLNRALVPFNDYFSYSLGVSF